MQWRPLQLTSKRLDLDSIAASWPPFPKNTVRFHISACDDKGRCCPFRVTAIAIATDRPTLQQSAHTPLELALMSSFRAIRTPTSSVASVPISGTSSRSEPPQALPRCLRTTAPLSPFDAPPSDQSLRRYPHFFRSVLYASRAPARLNSHPFVLILIA